MTPRAVAPSLDGRRFRSTTDVPGGEVGRDTTFSYRERDGVVHATFEGGTVVKGFLVGVRSGDSIRFRYCQLNRDGGTNSGRCLSRIEVLPDGRLRLYERWSWGSQSGTGISQLEEVPDRPAGPAARRRRSRGLRVMPSRRRSSGKV